jgi:hypothetical protein
MYEHIIHLNTQQDGGKSQISKNTILTKTSNLADNKVHLLMYQQKEINMYVHKSITMLYVCKYIRRNKEYFEIINSNNE